MPPDLDELLATLDEPIVERQPIAGIDYWKIVRPATSKELYDQQTERLGVDITCETCGKVKRVHPSAAAQGVWACSSKCRDAAWYRRNKKGEAPLRPLYPRPHKPWESRAIAKREAS